MIVKELQHPLTSYHSLYIDNQVHWQFVKVMRTSDDLKGVLSYFNTNKKIAQRLLYPVKQAPIERSEALHGVERMEGETKTKQTYVVWKRMK